MGKGRGFEVKQEEVVNLSFNELIMNKMNVDRRTALKNFLIISAGIVLIPSCLQNKGKSSILLKNFVINNNDEDLLEEVCETFIPTTDTPGAKDIGAHLFVLKMIDDCIDKEEQIKIIKGLKAFDKLAKKTYGKSFFDCDAVQRKEFFSRIEKKEDVSQEVLAFYKTTKKFTVRAYTTSEYYLTKVAVYELIPGRFHGCVPIGYKN